MENELYASLPAILLRIVSVAFLYVVNIFYTSYKYNKKMVGHYDSLRTSIQISSITGINDIKDFESLFDTIKTDKIDFEESQTQAKILELLKTETKEKKS